METTTQGHTMVWEMATVMMVVAMDKAMVMVTSEVEMVQITAMEMLEPTMEVVRIPPFKPTPKFTSCIIST